MPVPLLYRTPYRLRGPGEVLTPRASLRARCLSCVGWVRREVLECPELDCWLWPWRLALRGGPWNERGAEIPREGRCLIRRVHRRDRSRGEILTPRRSIRSYCLWCCGWQPREVELCPSQSCWLWPWRLRRWGGPWLGGEDPELLRSQESACRVPKRPARATEGPEVTSGTSGADSREEGEDDRETG